MSSTTKTMKLTSFTYEGVNKRGAPVKGKITGINIALVKAELRKQGITPAKVRKQSQSLFSKRKTKITSMDIAIFSRQLATMLSAGIPMIQAFEIVSKGLSNPSLTELITAIKNDVETGNSLAVAFSRHPRYFNDLFCNLIDAGEQSGTLDTMLDRVATYREKVETLRGKIKKALFYPATVLIVAFLVTVLLLLFVVPQFDAVFKSFGAELPIMTQTVVDMSKFIQKYWFWVFCALGAGVWALAYAHRTSPKFAFFVDKMMLKLPIIGVILQKASIARFSRTLATTFAAGLPLVDALKSVAGATGNRLYEKACMQIREDVSTGQQIHHSLRSIDLFPNMVVQMVAIGEESGSLEQMLSKVADFYEEEVDNAVDNLSSLLEPLIMVILGIIIGGLIVAMYLPIFKLGSVI